MKNIFPLIVLIAAIIAGYFLLQDKKLDEAETPVPATETPAPVGDPTFTWEYAPYMKGEFPYVVVTLAATYPDGTLVKKQVGDVQGSSCNDYPEPDADVYDSTMIICYFAGFGDYFKVVKVGNTFEVRHQEFGEASPDYEPPVMPYKTVATF